MSRAVLTAILLLILVTACGRDHARPGATASSRPEVADLMKAVSLGLPEFDRAGGADEPFKLIGAEQMILDGRYVWHLTFKPVHLLPNDPATDIGGLGGEIFVNVDLERGTTAHAGGE